MAEYSYDPNAYEKRYKKVYEAGADFWEQPTPTEALVRFLLESESRAGLNAVEFGCGEGRDSVFLAKSGLNVTALDASRSALKRANREFREEKVHVDSIVADVSKVPIKDESVDLVVNIACLHMMTDQRARDRRLRESHRVLRNSGRYFSCNLGVDEPMSVEESYAESVEKPGTLTSREIDVHGQKREILLPIIAAWPKSSGQYLDEFGKAGFKTLEISKMKTKPVGECWVIVAEK